VYEDFLSSVPRVLLAESITTNTGSMFAEWLGVEDGGDHEEHSERDTVIDQNFTRLELHGSRRVAEAARAVDRAWRSTPSRQMERVKELGIVDQEGVWRLLIDELDDGEYVSRYEDLVRAMRDDLSEEDATAANALARFQRT
jgi:hypothetical protein